MIKLTDKGKQLYEATKDYSLAEIDWLQEIAPDCYTQKEIDHDNVSLHQTIKSMREKGLIEGE
jgi:hypothetical protein